VGREKTKCEEDIRRFEAENSSMVKKHREMREQLMQCEKGLS
jgi:archaellum component FlaC